MKGQIDRILSACYAIFVMDFLMILFAKYLYMVIIGIATIYFFLQPRSIQKKFLLFAVISLPLTLIVAKIASHFYFDPRPFVTYHLKPLIPHAADNGFPSDHTLISAAFASLLFVFNKKMGIVAGVLALLVGISRIYVHVHSPIDIAGSFVIAILVAVLVDRVGAKFFRIGF